MTKTKIFNGFTFNSNDTVGIGAVAPSHSFQVNTNQGEVAICVDKAGKVWIGDTCFDDLVDRLAKLEDWMADIELLHRPIERKEDGRF